MTDASPEMDDMDPEAGEMEDDGMVENDQGQRYPSRLLEFADAEGDISGLLDDHELTELGFRVVQDWERDNADRADWLASAEKALCVAAQDPLPEKTYPFEGASRVNYPILVVAAQQFAARAYPAIVKGDTALRVKVIGDDPEGLKADRAARVRDYLNFRLFYGTEGLGGNSWEADVDTMLNQMPVTGMGFKKVYYDPLYGCRSDYVSPLRLTVPKDTVSLERAPRVTHDFDLYPYEIAARQRSKVYRDVKLESTDDDEQKPRLILEQHRMDDLDEDGTEEPYIVTVDKETNQVLRIEAAFTRKDVGFVDGVVVAVQRYMPFVDFPFLPDPKGGFYGLGFGKLLESLGAVINTSINQLLDAGHAQVAGGGFVTAGLRIQGAGQSSTIRFKPGEYKTVNVPSGVAKDAIWDRPVPSPSPVLFSLLDMILSSAKDISSVKDVLTGDAPATAPVGTTLALIEQGLQSFTAIYKRIYRSERREFRKIYECEKRWGDPTDYLRVLDDPKANWDKDFEGNGEDIVPVSDPTVVTRAQALAKAAFLQQFMAAPFANGPEIFKFALDAAEIDDAEKYLAPPQQGPPPGAAEELMKTKASAAKDQTQAVLNMAKAGQITGETLDPRGLGELESAPGDAMGVQSLGSGGGNPEAGMDGGDMGAGPDPGPLDPNGIEGEGGQPPIPEPGQL